MQWIIDLNILRIFSDLCLHLGTLNNFRTQIMPQFPTVLLGKEWNSHLLNIYYEPGPGLSAFTYPIPLSPTKHPAT